MNKNIDKVEIKEPPLQELNKKRSCLMKSCATGCGCVIIFIIGLALLLKFITTPRVKELKNIPKYITDNVPMYDTDNINKISFISGEERSKATERAAIIPKVMLAPVLITLQKNASDAEQNTNWEEFKKILREPIADHRDIYKIEWLELPAKPNFIYKHYQTELKNLGYKFNGAAYSNNTKKMYFKNKNKKIDGTLYIKYNKEKRGTDYVLLILKIPAQSQ